MLIVKRLDRFVLKSFLPLFAMTFFIVLFIVLMQFLWKYVDDLVGKGLEFSVIAELFFYAAVCMVPMSLPLAILLASLMTFGNFGEKSELTAMKASGISLVKVMRPLMIFIACVAVGAFFFQNNVLPKAQVKMWTLLFSMKQKSPEVEIPEGVFYDQIPGYNLFVTERDKTTGMLRRVMIYDVSTGGDTGSIITSDSAQLAFTKDMRHLYLHLFNGEQFENLSSQATNGRNIPFRRESFHDKQVLIPFDANFNRMDEGGMKKQYVGKNIAELRQTIDSVTARVDSMGTDYARILQQEEVLGVRTQYDPRTHKALPYMAVEMPADPPNLKELVGALSPSQQKNVYEQAIRLTREKKQEFEFKSETMADDKKSIRRHEIELIKKFTLSVACLIFFFIGAPLGAIIRKGGIGTPLVISVLLFLVYYIIDNTGYKMSRDGRWNVWFGMWLSTLILAPLGIYVTYKAMNDSSVFNKDSYRRLIHRIFCLPEKRHVALKEVVIHDVDRATAIENLHILSIQGVDLRQSLPPAWKDFRQFWIPGVDMGAVGDYADKVERLVEYLSDSKDKKMIELVNRIPVITRSWILAPLGNNQKVRKAVFWIFPVSILLYLPGYIAVRILKEEIDRTIAVCHAIEEYIETGGIEENPRVGNDNGQVEFPGMDLLPDNPFAGGEK